MAYLFGFGLFNSVVVRIIHCADPNYSYQNSCVHFTGLQFLRHTYYYSLVQIHSGLNWVKCYWCMYTFLCAVMVCNKLISEALFFFFSFFPPNLPWLYFQCNLGRKQLIKISYSPRKQCFAAFISLNFWSSFDFCTYFRSMNTEWFFLNSCLALATAR